MREDEDQFRQTMPVLRRIIILVAVVTAIPVVMWTITAFVRTYVGPPKAPDYRPLAIAPTNVAPAQASVAATAPTENSAASSAASGDQTPMVAEAKATTADAVASGPPPSPTNDNANAGSPAAAPADATMSAAAHGTSSSAMPADTAPAATASMPSQPSSDNPDMAASNSAPSGAPAPDHAMQFADQQPAAANWPTPTPTTTPPPAAAAALPPGEPIAGPVPLPRKRPSSFVLAQSGTIPLPMPRPEAAGPGAAEAPATPLDWLHNVFQPSQGGTPAPPSDDSGDYTETPH